VAFAKASRPPPQDALIITVDGKGIVMPGRSVIPFRPAGDLR
jgi:hypothetical protein